MMKLGKDAALAVLSLADAEGAAPEGGLRVDALRGSNDDDEIEISTSVAAMSSETDTVVTDEDTGARVFLDQASADVVGDRTLEVRRSDGDTVDFVLR